MTSRERKITVTQLKEMLARKAIRPASLQDVEGLHHQRELYRHPNTGQWFVAINSTETSQ